jgi:hypothetical protein
MVMSTYECSVRECCDQTLAVCEGMREQKEHSVVKARGEDKSAQHCKLSR